MMAKWDLNTRARELADRERRLYDQRELPAVLEELAAENEALRSELAVMHMDRDDMRYRLQAMHRRAQASEGKMARTVYILEAIVGYVKSARSPGDGRWWRLTSMVRSAIDHARRGTGKAMWADCHWYHEYEKRLNSRFAELEAEAARLRAEAENSAAQRDEALLRAEVAEEAKRAVGADFGASDEEWQNDEVLSIAAGRKDDSGKAPHHLIAPEIQDALAQVLDFGARKYAPRNWERGMAWSRPFSALMRHMWAWWRGEDRDAETGLSHLHHAACCLMFLIAYEARRTGEDDRPRAELARIRSDRQKGETL